MHSLTVTCSAHEYELISAELWEAGTTGISESQHGDLVILTAGFVTNHARDQLLHKFEAHAPEWRAETRDWVRHTQKSWPARKIGTRLFLAPPWCTEATPDGRNRIIHNPGLACGTGEHPCTQLALEALEYLVRPDITVADVGTGSGVLAIAALRLGANTVVAVDADLAVLSSARENLHLNGMQGLLVNGTADCIATAWADVTVANISGTVLLAILEDLRRMTKNGGALILTGFPESEAVVLRNELRTSEIVSRDGWCCLTTGRESFKGS